MMIAAQVQMSHSLKDTPRKWGLYKSGICEKCIGACCTMPVEVKAEDLIRLKVTTLDEVTQSLKKVAKKLKKTGIIISYREGSDLFMLSQKANDDCYFLDSKTRLCTVYKDRPNTCRDFPLKVGPRVKYCPFVAKR